MWLYTALDRVFPRSFTKKLLFVAFCGTHVPLIAVALYITFANPANTAMVLLTVLAATLVGTGLTFLAMWKLMAPVRHLSEALDEFRLNRRLPECWILGNDELARLASSARRMAADMTGRLESSLREAARDPLTGLLNRRGVTEALPDVSEGSVLFFDLDGFKGLNDVYGHKAGDEALIGVAGVLDRLSRKGDLVSRWGGDEFVVIMPHTTTEDAEAVGERMRTAIRREGTAVSATVGLAHLKAGDEWMSVIESADRAMLQGKSRNPGTLRRSTSRAA